VVVVVVVISSLGFEKKMHATPTPLNTPFSSFLKQISS
jgi:hypothetical protein